MGYKRNVNDKVKKLLYVNSGNKCAICLNPLIYANMANISEICHIEAVNEYGARYNSNLTDDYVGSYENLILLCPTCHRMIDNKQNENDYTVSWLKKMKQNHEQQVQKALMKKAMIEPPIFIKDYNVAKIVEKYNGLYEKEIDEEFVYETLQLILIMNITTRSIIYRIPLFCEEKTEKVNVQMLKMVDMDLYSYAEILKFLEQKKIIEETEYVDPLDGYETEDGDYHLVQNDYLFKTEYGVWYLNEKGRLITVLYNMFNNILDFYDLVVNGDLEKIKLVSNVL